MKRSLLVAVLVLLALPAYAAGPLALIAKQMIKQVVKDYMQSHLTSLVHSTLGPCKSMLASMANPATRAQMTQMMAGMQAMPGMGNATALSGEEVDELVSRLVVFSQAVPDQPLPCAPEELKLVFNMSASMPMMSAPFRMMLESFRQMDRNFAELREAFAKMSGDEQVEAIDAMLAEVPGELDVEDRKRIASFLQSDIVGLPPAAREHVRARLGF